MGIPKITAMLVGPQKVRVCIYKMNNGVSTEYYDTFDLSNGFPSESVRKFSDYCKANFDEVERMIKGQLWGP